MQASFSRLAAPLAAVQGSRLSADRRWMTRPSSDRTTVYSERPYFSFSSTKLGRSLENSEGHAKEELGSDAPHATFKNGSTGRAVRPAI